MTYNQYINRESKSIICEFTMSSDQAVISTSNYSETVAIDTVTGSSNITINSNIITLPKGYEFLIRFFVGVSRNSIGGELYAKVEYSNGNNVQDSTLAEIGGSGNNKSSLEDVTCVVDTSLESKEIIYKTHKNSGYNLTLLSEHCYGIIIGFEK